MIFDSITKLLLVAEKDAIIMVCNRLFKMTYFVVTIEGTFTERLAWLFKKQCVKVVKITGEYIIG